MMKLKVYIIWLIVVNAITIICYYVDKQNAINHRYRIKESVLLGLTILGGSLGALIGLYFIRHKNKHWYFVFITYVSLIIHILIGLVIIY